MVNTIKSYFNFIQKIQSHKLYFHSKKNLSIDRLIPSLESILSEGISEDLFDAFLSASKDLVIYAKSPVLLTLAVSDNYSLFEDSKSKYKFMTYIISYFKKRKEILANNLNIITSNPENNYYVSHLKRSSIKRIKKNQANYEDILEFNVRAIKGLKIEFNPSSINPLYSELVTYLTKFESKKNFFHSSDFTIAERARYNDYITFFQKNN